jgi:hypothetical protein
MFSKTVTSLNPIKELASSDEPIQPRFKLTQKNSSFGSEKRFKE